MNDPLLDIPNELNPQSDWWVREFNDLACCSRAREIAEYEGHTLRIGVGGGDHESKGRALATRSQLRRLCIDGRNIPQPLINATGELPELQRLQLGFIGNRSLLPLASLANLESLSLEGVKGDQRLSIGDLSSLRTAWIGGDSDAVVSLVREDNTTIRNLALGGLPSANLKLQDLTFLSRFPKIEHLILLNVSVKSRSLAPCLGLQNLKQVTVNYVRRWDRDSVETLREKGVTVRSRMDEINSQSV